MVRAIFAAISNLFIALFWVLGLPFRLFRREVPAVYVRFRLEGDPPYAKGRGARLFQRPEPDTVTSLDELSDRLDVLCADPRVRGVVFELQDLTVAPAKRHSLASLFQRVRRAGKEVVGYAVAASKLRMIAQAMVEPERIDSLFARVMSLIPPEELQALLLRDAPYV